MDTGHPHFTPDRVARAEERTDPWRRLIGRLRQGEARLDVVVLGALLTLVIFVIDLFLPLGVAGGVPYIAPVFLAMWLPDRRLIIVVAAVCSVLAAAGLWLSPLGADLGVAIPNRILAVTAIWVVAFLSMQRKHFESALAESEATHRAVLATTADGILTLDSVGRIVSANPAAERMFGYPASELRSRDFGILLGPAHGHAFSRLMEVDPRDPEDAAKTHELVGLHRDGSGFPLEVVLVGVPGEAGLNFTVTARDISERRLREQYLLRSSDEDRRAFGLALHEELGQAITGLHLISRKVARRLENQDYAEAREVSELAALLHEVDMQAIELFQTIAPVDANGGLPLALGGLVREASERYGVEYTLTGIGEVGPTDPLVATQLHHVVRELVYEFLSRGTVHHLLVGMGADGDDRSVTVRLDGTTTSDVRKSAELTNRLVYRANLVGARLEMSFPEEDVVLVTCSWSEAEAPAPKTLQAT